ncbi:MAG: TonB-dependent receptor [Bacteroidales bacterium]|nr:TonB-dependent receptor [Bacteroidales bacterium]
MKKINILISAIIIAMSMNSFTQGITKDTLELKEVVVTGTKTKRDLKEVPGRISVINSKTIELSPAQQVDDILRFTPGININRSTGIYSQRPMVTLRGLSGDEQSRTLVLINGVPINTSDEGGVNWNRINQYDVERIEVFKGPGSSLYGNNAMGGVINIITKKPTKPQEVYGGISYGTYNTLRQDLNVRIRNDKGYYGSISQYYLKSDGYNNVVDSLRTPYDIARSLEEISLSVKAGNDAHKWLRWELQYDVFRDRRGEGFQVLVPEGVYRNFNTNLFRINLRGGDSKMHYDLNAYYQLENYYDVNEKLKYKKLPIEEVPISDSTYSRYDVNSYREDMGLLFNINRQLKENNTLTAGFEYKQGSINGGDYYQTPRVIKDVSGNDSLQVYDTVYNAGKINTIAGYIQDEYAFFDNKVRLILGLRFDQVTFDDGEYMSTDPWNTIPELKKHTWAELSPRFGMRFNFIEELSAYISYSHGFRASILDDLTRTGWMWVGPKYANPELGPESLDNFELGADIFPVNNLKISASVFYATGKDFLYYIATGDSLYGRAIYIRENVTNVTLQGLEADVQYEIIEGLNILASYTFADSKINEFTEQPELENKYLKYVPKHSASASILWQNKYVNTSLRVYYKGEQFGDDKNTTVLDPYFTCDVQLSKQIKENYIISLDVQDIFDNQHMETIDYLSPGRLITGRIAIKF